MASGKTDWNVGAGTEFVNPVNVAEGACIPIGIRYIQRAFFTVRFRRMNCCRTAAFSARRPDWLRVKSRRRPRSADLLVPQGITHALGVDLEIFSHSVADARSSQDGTREVARTSTSIRWYLEL